MYRTVLSIVLLTFFVSGCSTVRDKNSANAPGGNAAGNSVLDVGVTLFGSADNKEASSEDAPGDPVAIAESLYVPYLLTETLKQYRNWGIVRLLPDNAGPMDVLVKGTILLSDGKTMEIQISVTDSTGREWYTRTYQQTIGPANYDPESQQNNDPFQVIYNNIANDLLAYSQRNINNAQLAEIRMVSEMLFAQHYLPDAFSSYLSMDRRDNYQLTSRPKEDDPLLLRVRDLRERDFTFIDTLQDSYATYAHDMRPHYDSWREQSFLAARVPGEANENTAKRRFIQGTAAVLGGLAAEENGGRIVAQGAKDDGIGDDATLIKSGFDRQADARMHMAELEKLAQAFQNDMTMREIDLGNSTFILAGTIEEQYDQWRGILAGIYAPEAAAEEEEE